MFAREKQVPSELLPSTKHGPLENNMLPRREFLASVFCAVSQWTLAGQAGAGPSSRKKVAFLGTEVRPLAHAQHFLDRLTLGYPWAGKWQKPRVDLAGVYIDQFPEGDLARGRVKRHNLKLFPTVAEALTLGTGKLAVDGVVIIGEHGNYPKNGKGQVLYPRYRWFKDVVKVFEESGRSVPVFNDKHLSTEWAECKEMVEDSRRLGFPFLAGSSLPVTRREPQTEVPYGADLTESLCVAYGGVDSYDFHAFETAQCMAERRKGGEAGVVSVRALKNEAVWNELAGPEREATRKLFVAALNRSHNLPAADGYVTDAVTLEWARANLPTITGFFFEHAGGFRSSSFLTGVRDFTWAGQVAGEADPMSCVFHLPMPKHGATTADFFHPLCRQIEEMVLTGATPVPVERTLLTSGLVIAGVDSLAAGGKPLETPHLKIAYQGPRESLYWRE